MFEKRQSSQKCSGLFLGQILKPGDSLEGIVSDGDDVTLKVGEERVSVKNIKYIGHLKYKGKISGFNPSYAFEFSGLKVRDEVEFFEENIFSCS